MDAWGERMSSRLTESGVGRLRLWLNYWSVRKAHSSKVLSYLYQKYLCVDFIGNVFI